jgi:hypothetical protein
MLLTRIASAGADDTIGSAWYFTRMISRQVTRAATETARLFQAPGWVAKTSVVAVALMAVYGVGLWRLGDHAWHALAALVLASMVFGAYVGVSAWLVSKFPLLQLEGSDLRDHLRSIEEPARPKSVVHEPELPDTDEP